MINENFIFLGVALNLIGTINYLVNTVKGKTQPNRVTFFLWALAPLIAFAFMLSEGVGKVALMTLMVGLGPLLIFVASFLNKKSYWRLTKFDYLCGILSIVGIFLWLLTKDANLAILLAVIADLFAGLPTVVKAFKAPETESYLAFLLGSVSAVVALLTIDNWTFAAYAFPIHIALISFTIFVLVKFEIGKKYFI